MQPIKFSLFENIKNIIAQTQQNVVRNINQAMLFAYFQIGKMIVEDEQHGNQRADYAKETMQRLSEALNKEFGKGYSVSNLEYMRNFYMAYQDRISQTLFGKSGHPAKSQTGSGKFENPFKLSWSHYILLLKVKNEEERSFYEIEAAQNNWSVRELGRQYNSALYERLALSTDKRGIKQLAEKGQLIEKPVDALKNHYVLEFLGLKENSNYSENDLEIAIIDKLEHFMLELGKGFLFEGRQRRFTFEGDSFLLTSCFITGY